ncbi:ThiJ/PfpI domain-containing protein [Golovinomyces cichoracearum]|uniref:ThiJ/PfpI domain-containing protein n=1 Tax=Golovinomyces cichoracearum TaxID=62708 RepID=A0A420J5X7_9PEZI|nr:ThiJ/PfpI domain-containing protein [Golovinomyces cichoracearum]
MSPSDASPKIRVLITMHPGMDTLDFAGPLEVLSQARHRVDDEASCAFGIEFVSATEETSTAQGAVLKAHMNYKAAYACLSDYDILIVPGGAIDEIIKSRSEPLGLITAYSEIQKKDPKRERTILSICTGSMFLAYQGILSGLKATTHPDYYAKFEKICSETAQRELAERCDVVEERYVVNNLRYDLGENPDENPYVHRKNDTRKQSLGRSGSDAFQESNRRRESIARRAAIRLGGLRVITSGAMTCGLDASLYLVRIMVSTEAAAEIERNMMYEWKKGVVVDGIDV